MACPVVSVTAWEERALPLHSQHPLEESAVRRAAGRGLQASSFESVRPKVCVVRFAWELRERPRQQLWALRRLRSQPQEASAEKESQVARQRPSTRGKQKVLQESLSKDAASPEAEPRRPASREGRFQQSLDLGRGFQKAKATGLHCSAARLIPPFQQLVCERLEGLCLEEALRRSEEFLQVHSVSPFVLVRLRRQPLTARVANPSRGRPLQLPASDALTCKSISSLSASLTRRASGLLPAATLRASS